MKSFYVFVAMLCVSGFCNSCDWLDNIGGGNLLCLSGAGNSRIQHPMGGTSSGNSSLASLQYRLPLFQSCLHVSRKSTPGNLRSM